MVIPQINGTVKNLAAAGVLGMLVALTTSYHNDVLHGWADLLPALQASSFTGFMAMIAAVVAWLTMRSTLSQSAVDDKNLQKTVEAVTGLTGTAAKEQTAQVKAEATDHAITKLVQSQ